MITGFVTGRFCPFHKGHEALIEYAKSNCDKLIIFISALPNDSIPYKYRLKWVLSTYLDDPKIEVFGDIINEPNFTFPDDLSIWWGQYVNNRFGKIDRIFSSENYGELFAKGAGAENWLFDKSRNIIPISGTMIRNKPLTYWNYINSFAKDYFIKKFAIVGTESTGKTVLAERLAEHYNTQWCPEIGRDLIPDAEKCTIDDLKIVGTEHAKNILKYTRLSNKILFVDTDLTITKSYSKFLFGEVPKYDSWVENTNNLDYYIYLNNKVPYIDDGTRLSEIKRNELNKNHLDMFSNEGKNLNYFYFPTSNIIKSKQMTIEDCYEYRFNEIVKYIDYEISKL